MAKLDNQDQLRLETLAEHLFERVKKEEGDTEKEYVNKLIAKYFNIIKQTYAESNEAEHRKQFGAKIKSLLKGQ